MKPSELKTILYVEDEEDIRTIAIMALEAGGLKVIACRSGREALETGLSHSPDLVLLDVMMPGMDGPSAWIELKKIPHLASTPAVFMTAKTQKHEIDSFKKMGAIGVITKPFDPLTLADTLRELWQLRPL